MVKNTKQIFKKRKTVFQKFLSFVRSYDMYGKDIVLTYKGDDKYRTHLGGFASVLVGGVILAYIVYLFFIMFSKGDTNIARASIVNDISSEVEILKPAKDHFDFAVSYVDGSIDYLNDPTYFTFEINQVEQTRTTSGGTVTLNRARTSIPFAKCGDNFNHHDQSEVRQLGIDSYYCPTSDNYSVAGTFFSNNFNYVEIKLLKCTSGSCKSSTDIENAMKNSRFSIAIENTIVDMGNYQEPIQRIIDDGFFWELVPGFRKKTDIYIRKNTAEFEDNYIQLGFPTEKNFFQLGTHADSFESEPSEGDILTIYFRYDKVSDLYERKIFSLAELLGQAGGFYGSLLAIGALFIFIFSERLFIASVLKKIYQIDTMQEQERFQRNYRMSRQQPYEVK
jgi:hypothetical protein